MEGQGFGEADGGVDNKGGRPRMEVSQRMLADFGEISVHRLQI